MPAHAVLVDVDAEPGAVERSTWPRAVAIGCAVTSSASAMWVSVSAQAMLGMTLATCSAAAQAMLDSPVLQEMLTLMPRLSHSAAGFGDARAGRRA